MSSHSMIYGAFIDRSLAPDCLHRLTFRSECLYSPAGARMSLRHSGIALVAKDSGSPVPAGVPGQTVRGYLSTAWGLPTAPRCSY
jgi:hypothetical protein